MVLEQFGRGFGDENVNPALDGVKRNRVMRGVWGEDGDGAAGGERVDGGLVGFGIRGGVGGIRGEGGVEAIVDIGDVLLQMFACGGEKLKVSACEFDRNCALTVDHISAAFMIDRSLVDSCSLQVVAAGRLQKHTICCVHAYDTKQHSGTDSIRVVLLRTPTTDRTV